MRKFLKEIAVISSGQNAPQGSNDYSDNGIPFVKAGNLYELLNGRDINEIQKVSNDVAKKFKLKLFKKGTILFAKSGMSCLKGYVYILPCDAYVVNHLACVIPKENISDYLSYFFNYHKPNQLIKDSAYPSISLSDIGNIAVNLVEDSERVHHVQVLDGIQKIVLAKKQELKLLDDLIKARFVEMFGDPISNPKKWLTKPFLSMGTCKNGMNFHYEDSGIEINCLGVGDFKDLAIITDASSLPIISLNAIPSSEYLLQDGDIVFVRSNGNKKMVGRSVVVYPGIIPTTFSGFCIRYRLNDRAVDISYLLRVLKTDSVRQKMYGRGANIQNLNQQTLSSLVIPVPPLEMQKQFSNFVAQIDKSKFSKIA